MTTVMPCFRVAGSCWNMHVDGDQKKFIITRLFYQMHLFKNYKLPLLLLSYNNYRLLNGFPRKCRYKICRIICIFSPQN